MVPAASCVVVCAAFLSVHALEVRRIDPELDPESDKEHQKDYPKDQRPEVPKGWKFDHLGGHPYPVVATAADFDKDFVRDENGDGGEWSAQMAYDTLRARVVKEKEEVEIAARKEAEEKAEYEQAVKDEAAAEKASERAEKTAAEAKLAEKEADEKVERLTGKEDGENQTSVGGLVGDAAKQVEKEMSDLDKCKEELAAAKARLKELMDEKAAREAAALAAANQTSNATFNTSSLAKVHETLEERLARAQREHQAAIDNLKKQEQDVKQTQEDLAEAKKKLQIARAASKQPKKTGSSAGAFGAGKTGAAAAKSAAAATSAFGAAWLLTAALAAV